MILGASAVGLTSSTILAQPAIDAMAAIDPPSAEISVLASAPSAFQLGEPQTALPQADQAANEPLTGHFGLQLLLLFALTGIAIGVVYTRKLWRLSRDRLRGTSALHDSRPTAHLLLLCGLGLWLAMQVGGGLSAQTFVTPLPDGTLESSLHTTALGLLGMYVTGAVVLGLLLWRFPNLMRIIGLHAQCRDILLGAGWLLLALPILFLVSTLMTIIATWVQGTPPDAAAHTTLRMLNEGIGGWGIAVMALVVVGAPFFEEVIYRGFIQTSVRIAGGTGQRSRWWAIILSSILFASIHIGAVEWYALPTLITLAIILGVAYERSGRLAVPIVIHSLFNAVQLVMSLVQSSAAQSTTEAFATLPTP